ncbi:hypothetical protein [Streptomyces hygroscopicus]|uniref:hypothetical protein n=1 Tax=Streptomyces hygroscopicus TaxID=1912 RepID=UPI00223F5D97|nr:hypothetical protein [Streptomyces hygroscopicus]
MRPPTVPVRRVAALVVAVLAVVLGLCHPSALAAPRRTPRAAVYDVRDYGVAVHDRL